MTAQSGNEHPALLLRRLGVSERPAALVIILLILLQYLFLAKLWEGYPIRWVNDVIHINVVIAGIVLSVLGVLTITGMSYFRWSRADATARRLDKPATDTSFDAIRSSLEKLTERSTLNQQPDLFYHMKDALALEVREYGAYSGAVVVGLQQRDKQRQDQRSFEAQLGHEISHIEVGATRFEIGARRLIAFHFRVFFLLLVVFLMTLGFIDRLGIGSEPPAWGFAPVFDTTIYIGLSVQITVLILSAVIVFVYSYFFVVRREHIHDVRGSQLAKSNSLATSVFDESQSPHRSNRVYSALKEYLALHPNPNARRRIVLRRDVILISAVTYPAIVSGIQPLAQLLTAGWRTFFEIEQYWWNLGLTFTTGLVLFMALSADVARFGLTALVNSRRIGRQISVYAAIAGIGTQVPRILLEVIYGLRKGFPVEMIGMRIWNGILTGGLNLMILVVLLLVVLTYLSAVRAAATGEHVSGRWFAIDTYLKALLVLGGFAAVSLKNPGIITGILIALSILFVFHLSFYVLSNSCPKCKRRRVSALLLKSQCVCGYDHLVQLHRWTREPYEHHIQQTGYTCAN